MGAEERGLVLLGWVMRCCLAGGLRLLAWVMHCCLAGGSWPLVRVMQYCLGGGSWLLGCCLRGWLPQAGGPCCRLEGGSLPPGCCPPEGGSRLGCCLWVGGWSQWGLAGCPRSLEMREW